MEKIIEKLYNSRNDDSARSDYAAFLKEIFREAYDFSVNDDEAVASEAARLLSTFGGLCRFFTEERYLRGKSLKQTAEYFRSVVDSEEFVIACVEDGFDNFMDCFLDIASDIFDEIKSNNFREPQENGKPSVLPQTENYYEKDAFKSVFCVLRASIDEYEAFGERFEDAYTEADFEKLRDIFIGKLYNLFFGIKDNDFLELWFYRKNTDAFTDDNCESGALKRVVEVLSDALSELEDSEYLTKEFFEGYLINGKKIPELSRGLSESSEEFVEKVCNAALRKAWQRGNKLRQLADKYRIA